MTVKEVVMRVHHIRVVRRDDEAAHSFEDELYADIFRSMASAEINEHTALRYAKHWQRLAAEALKTKDIDFGRWCA